MCNGLFGSQPQAPTVQYVGPSQAELNAQQASLDAFQKQIQQQQADTAAQMQQQIDAANARTAEIQSTYDEELATAREATAAAEERAKAAAGASYTPEGAYGVTASISEAPAARTTEKIKPKKKPRTSLKISPTASTVAGSGLNLGI